MTYIWRKEIKPESNSCFVIFYFSGSSKGFYMYIETSSPRKSNESARMSSMTFRPSSRNDSCYMRFWYHMFGKDVDTLSIKLRISVIGPLIPLWNRTGVVSFSSSADANRVIVLCLFGLFLSIYCFQRDNVTLFLKTLDTTACCFRLNLQCCSWHVVMIWVLVVFALCQLRWTRWHVEASWDPFGK